MSIARGAFNGWFPDGYEFVQQIGSGSHGQVALGRQRGTDRLVALKFISVLGVDDPGFWRLRREGRVLVGLRHPNVVRVFELQTAAEGACLILEYVPGGDLRTALDSGRLTGADRLQILSDVASGLCYAHAQVPQVAHRDLKPANVLLHEGRAKIADFGLARRPSSLEPFRTTGSEPLGTPMYMAPEQISNPQLDSPSVDAYAFAVLAYELMTGAMPFRAATKAQLLRAHVKEAPVPASIAAPDLPHRAASALTAGLSKDPAKRISPRELVTRLTAISTSDWGRYFNACFAEPAGHGWSQHPEVTNTDGSALQASTGENERLSRAWIRDTPAGNGTKPGESPIGASVQPPVYHPPARLARQYLWSAQVLGAAVGVIVALIVAAEMVRR